MQSSTNKIDIYDLKLNARDAWSKLITTYGNYNINFIRSCENNRYELNAGLTIDNEKSNFFQLIQNLLTKFKKWDDIIINDITGIEDKTDKGIGNIIISHRKYNTIIIHFLKGHYYMEIENKKNNDVNINKYLKGSIKYKYIVTLLKKYEDINSENYLYIKYDSNLLIRLFVRVNIDLKKKLFELSLTKQFDDDTKRRMKIDVTNNDFFQFIIEKSKHNLNEYTFRSKNFEFLEKLKTLTHLNIEVPLNAKEIDFSPFFESNITSIGDDFLNGCNKLTSIDLSGLSNVTSIGRSFATGCFELESIDLSGLSKVTSIGDYFLYRCMSLEIIDLSGLSNVTSIGNNFLNRCKSLTNIDLSGLSNITSIGNYFLEGCLDLEIIDLSGLSNVTSIGNHFLYGCVNLERIDLRPLVNLTSIGRLCNDLSCKDKIMYTQNQLDILRINNQDILKDS